MAADAPAGSRVFRQVVTMELLMIVDPDWKPTNDLETEVGRPKFDGEALVRDAVMGEDSAWGAYLVPGHGEATKVQELAPTGEGESDT